MPPSYASVPSDHDEGRKSPTRSPASRGGGRAPEKAQHLVQTLSFLDGMGTVVGIIIGSGIFTSAGVTLREAGGNCRLALVAWASASCLVAVASLCYCELGASIPSAGGDAEYLRQAYGDGAAFLFIWANFWIFKPGSQAIIATVFGQYVVAASHPGSSWVQLDDDLAGAETATQQQSQARALGVAAIVGLTALNCTGVRWGGGCAVTCARAPLVSFFVAKRRNPHQPALTPGLFLSLSHP